MGSTIPALPVLDEDDSMLSRKFGREIANYFSGSPLNRIAFLRHDHVFLRSAFSHPSTRFLLMNELAPLVDDTRNRLAYLNSAEVTPFTGPDPFAKTEEEMIKDFNSEESHPLILLLGIDEAHKLESNDNASFEYKNWKGRPYFAIDITPQGVSEASANSVIDVAKQKGFSFFTDQRHMGLSAAEGNDLMSHA